MFSAVPFSAAPFDTGPVISGSASVYGDAAITINLSVAGVGEFSATSNFGNVNITLSVSGTGGTTVSADGAVQLDLVLSDVAAHGVYGQDGHVALELDVYSLTRYVTGYGNIKLSIPVSGLSTTTVSGNGTISLDIDVVGEGNSPVAVGAAGRATLELILAGVGSHGIAGYGSPFFVLSPAGQGRRGVSSQAGEVVYSLEAYGRGRYSSPHPPALIAGYGDASLALLEAGLGAIGVTGRGTFSCQLQVVGIEIMAPVGRGSVLAALSAIGEGRHDQPISVFGNFNIQLSANGVGEQLLPTGFVIGGNRNPLHLTISGSGYHA